MRRLLLAVVAGIALAGCGNKPPQPDWQMNAHDSLQRAAQAWLGGDARIEAAEFERARAAVRRTGRADLLARIELSRCAWRVASLQFEDCSGFVAIEQDAGPAERAYAAYLAGAALPAVEVALLPEAQRPVAAAGAPAEALARIEDPLSRLVAAGVLFKRGNASPAVVAGAVETASAQGWRRPLVAWLGVEAARASAAGDAAAAARVQRRIDRVLGEPAKAAPPAGRAASAPVAAGRPADAAYAHAFRTLRQLDCARCHGRDHDGPGAPSLVAAAASRSAAEFVAAMLDGNPARGMPPYRTNPLAVAAADDLYAYFRARAERTLGADWRPPAAP